MGAMMKGPRPPSNHNLLLGLLFAVCLLPALSLLWAVRLSRPCGPAGGHHLFGHDLSGGGGGGSRLTVKVALRRSGGADGGGSSSQDRTRAEEERTAAGPAALARPDGGAVPLEAFWELGVAGPFPLEHKARWLAPDGFDAAVQQYRRQWEERDALGGRDSGLPPEPRTFYRQQSRPPFIKSLWVEGPGLLEVALQPDIIARVNRTIGPNIAFFGGVSVHREQGGTHEWHNDVETSLCNRSVTIWLATKNISPDSTLQFISHSHLADEPIVGAVYLTRCAYDKNITSDPARQRACIEESLASFEERAAALAARVRAKTGLPARVLTIDNMTDGDFLMFHGATYHGAPPAKHRPREAIVLHYADPSSCEMRVPFAYDVLTARQPLPQAVPPGLMVAGTATPRAHALNYLIERDAPLRWGPYRGVEMRHLGHSSCSVWPLRRRSVVFPWRDVWRAGGAATAEVASNGREFVLAPHEVRSSQLMETYWLQLGGLAAFEEDYPITTTPGSEELVFVINGTVSVLLSGPDGRWPSKWMMGPGTLMHQPGSVGHTFICVDEGGCTLLFLKWRPALRPPNLFTPAGFRHKALPTAFWLPLQDSEGAETVLERAQMESGLFLRLLVRRLAPRERTEPRADAHDALLIVLEGSLLLTGDGLGLQGRRLAYGEAAIVPAGARTALAAAGDTGCAVLVAELHPLALPPDLARLQAGESVLRAMHPAPGVPPAANPVDAGAHAAERGLVAPPLQYVGTWAEAGKGFAWQPQQPASPRAQNTGTPTPGMTPGLTIATHGDLRRLPMIRRLCRAFKGPVSVALLAPTFRGGVLTDDEHDAADSTAPWLPDSERLVPRPGMDVFTLHAEMTGLLRELTDGGDCLLTVQLYVTALERPEDRHTTFPHNALRNAALAAVSTELVTVLDADLLPSGRLSQWHGDPAAYAELLELLEQAPPPSPPAPPLPGCANGTGGGGRGERISAVVLPVWDANCTSPEECDRVVAAATAGTKADVARTAAAASELLLPFRMRCPQCYAQQTDYPRWLNATAPYPVAHQWPFEPFLVTRTRHSLWFDERFFGYFQDKASNVMRLALLGARFVVHDQAWLTHHPHNETDMAAMRDARSARVIHKLCEQARDHSQDIAERIARWHQTGDPSQLVVRSSYAAADRPTDDLGPRFGTAAAAQTFQRCPSAVALNLQAVSPVDCLEYRPEDQPI